MASWSSTSFIDKEYLEFLEYLDEQDLREWDKKMKKKMRKKMAKRMDDEELKQLPLRYKSRRKCRREFLKMLEDVHVSKCLVNGAELPVEDAPFEKLEELIKEYY